MAKRIRDRAVRLAPHVVVTVALVSFLGAVACWIKSVWTPEWILRPETKDAAQQVWYYGANNSWLNTGNILLVVAVIAAIGRFAMWRWSENHH